MCGRYTLRRLDLIRGTFEAILGPGFEEFTERPRFNIAPSQNVPVVRMNSAGQTVAGVARWGLIPSWTKGKPRAQPINSRSETLATSGLFRQAFARRRCLIPADGFYEWKGAAPPKQPYFFHMKDDSLFAFAGLWERWRPADDAEPIDTFTILTTRPNELSAPIHNRMPVILHRHDYARWIDRDVPGEDVGNLLDPFDADRMEVYPVSTQVNKVKNDGPSLTDGRNPA
ncbi:MAG TPA: SOS response-associated peptidase [Tepidisphaeraceae bacterium]|nr:SOS response-associated peptidase [Tepidisphaeraceae bacterium]